MEDVYHPRDCVGEAHEMGERNIEELLSLREDKKRI
jgi:hypothetical protein